MLAAERGRWSHIYHLDGRPLRRREPEQGREVKESRTAHAK